MNSIKLKSILFVSTLIPSITSFAATQLDLSQTSPQMFKLYVSPNKAFASQATALKTVKVETDSQNTTHTRVKQMYAGIPVWGGDAVIHTPQGGKKNLATLVADNRSTMNGNFYRDLEKDLQDNSMFNPAQKTRALEKAKNEYSNNYKNVTAYSDESVEPLIFIADDNKAHYTYQVSFYSRDKQNNAHRPVFILDAATLHVYKTWDNIQTAAVEVESMGGNPILGKLFYDAKQFEKLLMYVNGNQCQFENDNVVFKRALSTDIKNKSYPLITASCHAVNGAFKIDVHDKESYEGADGYNGAYSPASDALYGVSTTQKLFKAWYGIPVFSKANGEEEKITVLLHRDSKENSIYNWNNAEFDSATKLFSIGDGDQDYYPLATLEILAHELGHGFTFRHSNLIYVDQSGGMNEAFSDMTSKAAEFMVTGKNIWVQGPGALKNGMPLRYMDTPTKDGVSIDNVKDYAGDNRPMDMNVHYTSGIFNKAFYHLATTSGWDTKKAFDVMVAANRFYWRPTTTFQQGACEAVMAAKELKYNAEDVKNAFAQVGITGLDVCTRPWDNIFPIDKTPSCPMTPVDFYDGNEKLLLRRDQMPCHFDTINDVYIPIVKEETDISFTNYRDHETEMSVKYMENCGSHPVRKNEDVMVPAFSTVTVHVKTNCRWEGNPMNVITAGLPGKREGLKYDVVISYN